jgi:hypothetical protein
MKIETVDNPYADSLNEIADGLLDHAVRVQDGCALPYEYEVKMLGTSFALLCKSTPELIPMSYLREGQNENI